MEGSPPWNLGNIHMFMLYLQLLSLVSSTSLLFSLENRMGTFPSAIPPQTTQAILRPLALLLGFEAGLLEYSLISVLRKDERQKEKKKRQF